jgi:uracil-DNA glycosylase
MKEQSPNMEPSWLEAIGTEFEKPYMVELRGFLVEEMRSHKVYPPGGEMFRAFWKTPFHSVRVVVLGQDPYHGPGQAHGLSFSVPAGVTRPPSLRNIFKELHSDLGLPIPMHGDLSDWAERGVLLLNTVLSVRHRQAHSHKGRGWEIFTDRVITELDTQREGLVFVLWGAHAGKKAQMIDRDKHLVIRSPHPSPFSADRVFLASKPFSRINEYLQNRGGKHIEWHLTREEEP